MSDFKKLGRRDFLITCATGTIGILLGCSSSKKCDDYYIDEYILTKIEKDKIPGLSACIIRRNDIIWQKSYGYENIEKNKMMSIDSILNIGSISKTITCTALLQLWEKNKFNLDDDICKYLPFKVRNPFYPEEILTFRQLLTHTSSLNDGSNYLQSYSCGDPIISLGEWLKDYLLPEGKYFVKEENFNNWKPGEKYDYSNVGFGLIGYLVETISGKPFNDYCRLNIFNPLQMDNTSWFLSELDQTNLAVPYTHISKEKNIDKKLIKYFDERRTEKSKDFIPFCFYSFPNYPDGLLHTSLRQLSNFLIAFLNEGLYRNIRILHHSTVKNILSNQAQNAQLPSWMSSQGLAWNAGPLLSGKIVWGHSGSDLGISTRMHFNAESGLGVIVFVNSNAELWDLTNVLFKKINSQ